MVHLYSFEYYQSVIAMLHKAPYRYDALCSMHHNISYSYAYTYAKLPTSVTCVVTVSLLVEAQLGAPLSVAVRILVVEAWTHR